MRKRPLPQSDLWLSTVRGVCWGWSPSASPGNIGHSPGRFPMRSCLEPHTMGIPQPFAVSLLSSPLPSVPLGRDREVSVTLLAHGCVMPIWGIPAGLPQDDPVGQCLQHVVAFSRSICRSESKDLCSSHGSPSLGILPGAWGQGRWQIVARAAAEVTRYSSLAQLVTGDGPRGWTSCTKPMAKSLPHPQDGAGSRAASHNETGVGHLFMIPDPGRQIVALRPTRLDAPRGECYISFEPVPKIRGALHRTYPDSRTLPDRKCALKVS